ncbi:MAG TPA: ribokinase [Myxococcales bacterium]|nr:ribokinase [Myxococcales bacterium]
MYDVVVVGKANVDYLVRGPRLPGPGQSVTGDAFHEAAGGKGANQAVGAARLGAKVALVARVGRDARGDTVIAALHDAGVETRFVTRDDQAPTGVGLCQVGASGEKQILSAAGANAKLSAACVRQAEEALGATRMVLCQLGVPLEAVEEAFRIGRGARALAMLDPGPPAPVPDSLIAQLDVIRPNASEAQALTGIAVRDRGQARAAAQDLLRRGARIAAVQAGEHGDVLLSHDQELWLPRFEVERLDATGAGDAFASALAVCLAEGRPLEEAGPFASAAAALATTVLGAQASLPRREAVLALLSGK